MKKSVIRIFSFLIIITLVLLYCNSVLKPKSADGLSTYSAFYDLDKNTVDVLVLGSSHAFVNFSTDTLWSEYGISSFNLGGGVQPFWNTYYNLKEALKTQKPELIVLDAYAATLDFDYSDSNRTRSNTFGMKWSMNKLKSICVSTDTSDTVDYLLSYSQYHTRYSSLQKGDFVDDFGSQTLDYNWMGPDWKGQFLFNTSNHVDMTDVSNVNVETPLLPKEEEYYRKIIELAQDENIPIVVVVVPYALDESEQSKYLAAERIAEEYGVEFINYNLMLDEIGLDCDSDYHDFAHMTAIGASKYTKFVADHLKENYTISDHRGDPKYSTWDRWADYCEQYKNSERLIKSEDTDSLSELLKNENYYVFITVDGTCNTSSEGISGFLGSQGIYEENSNGIWLVQGGVVKYSSGNENYEQYITNGKRDFCIRHDAESNTNEVIIDNNSIEKKVENGVNVTVYDNKTNMIIGTFGVDYDDNCNLVKQKK